MKITAQNLFLIFAGLVTIFIVIEMINDFLNPAPKLPPNIPSCNQDADCKSGQFCGISPPFTQTYCKDFPK